MFDGRNPHEAKILAFKQKAPAPKEGHLNQFNVLFSAHASSESSKMRAPRHIPSLAERILDAPNIRNDFYSNNLDWSRRNVVAIALQDTESDNDVVYLWDAGSGNISKLTTSDRVVCSVKFTEDGNHLSIGKEDGSIEIWDTMTGQGVRRLVGHEGKVFTLGWNPNYLISSGDSLGKVRFNDARIQNSFRAEVQLHNQQVCGMKWNQDGNLLATGGNDNKVSIYDINHNRIVHQFTEHNVAVKALAWCPWQKEVLATGAGSADRHIRFYNVTNGVLLNSIDTQSQVSSLVWSSDPSCKEIVSGHGYAKNQLCVWKYPSLVKVAELTGHTERILQMSAGPDNQSVVSVGADETLRFWKIFQSQPKPKTTSAQGVGMSALNSTMSKASSHHLIR